MRLLPLLSLSLMPAMAGGPAVSVKPVEPARLAPQAVDPAAVASLCQLDSWLQLLHDYEPVLKAGVEALSALDAADKAEAALPAIRAVQAGDDAIRAAAREMEANRFFADDILVRDDVQQAVRALPVGRYHRERARILRAGCYGDVALFLALTGREGRFSPGQVAAPISDAERVTLDRMQELNGMLAAIRTEADGEKAGKALLPLVRAISDDLPAMNPAALCEAERLRQETDSHLARLTNGYLLRSRLLDALLLQPRSYLADSLMTRRGEFATLGLAEHSANTSFRMAVATQHCDAFRAAHAEAVAAFCRENGLRGGDGSTPDEAIALPQGLHEAECRALMLRFDREVMGDAAVPFIGYVLRERLDGRPCTYVLGNAGSTGDTNYCGDKTLLVPYYFLLP